MDRPSKERASTRIAQCAQIIPALTLILSSACSDVTRPDSMHRPSSAARHSLTDPSAMHEALAPQRVVRETGQPQTVSFTLAGYGPAAVLHVANGDADGGYRATSAEIFLDGERVVDPSHFKKKAASFDVPLTIGNPATVGVRLAGAPGSAITISVDAAGSTAATLTAAGGDARFLAGQAELHVPSGALSAPVTVTADPATPAGGPVVNANLVAGSAIEFGPEGTRFEQPITMSLHYDPQALPPRFSEAALRLATLVDGRWVALEDSHVNPSTHTVTGQTTHFSTYGVVAFETFTQMSIGDAYACGITPSQDAYCWGNNAFGQLGTPSATTCANGAASVPCSTKPTLVSGGIKWTAIAAGGLRTCGLATSGDAYCWGSGSLGKIGDGGQADRPAPAHVSGGLHFVALGAGAGAACGLTDAGKVYCWGANPNGDLGTTTTETCASANPNRPPVPCSTTPEPVATALSFTELSVGLANACALAADHSAWCWGWGLFGVNGDGTTQDRFAPVQVAGGLAFSHISSGGLSSCGLVGATPYCWGTNNSFRMLGIGVAPDHFTPIAVSGGLSFDVLIANNANNVSEHNCGLTSAGDIWCWGGNDAQQLGSTVSNDSCGSGVTFACQNVPVQVGAGIVYRTLAIGGEETCATGTDGEAYCFGNDTFGQIGDGTVSTSRVITRVPRP